MKLLIAVDMEGISGVVDRSHVDSAHAEYQRFRRVMTEDVNAAVRGAADAGADEIVVADGHGGAKNILIEELDPRARLNSGSPSTYAMVTGIDKEIDAVFLVGYHARRGSRNAILSHTWSGLKIADLWINGRPSGEIGLNASVCGHFGVPVIMISGDQTACAEAEEWLPGIETAVVKIANSRSGAECLSLKEAHERIEKAAGQAVKRFKKRDMPAPLHVQTPVRIKVEYLNAAMADSGSLLPGATRLDGRTIEFEMNDMLEAYRAFQAAVSIA